MLSMKMFDSLNKPNFNQKKEIVDFLHENLEKYRDPKPDIEKSLDYAIKEYPSFGGFALVSKNENKITGAVIVNQTGMKGYIPENILVYIATHKDFRGKGIGKKLMQKTLELAKGDVALHVERDNPARVLYEKMGFTSKYMEMRYKRKKK